jgi:hypothetical protein
MVYFRFFKQLTFMRLEFKTNRTHSKTEIFPEIKNYLKYHLHVQWRLWVFNTTFNNSWGPSWPWSYGSWIYNYICNQCIPPLMLWVRISIRAKCTILCDKVCLWLATGRWFFPGTPVSSTNKNDITEMLFKVTLHTIKQTNKINNSYSYVVGVSFSQFAHFLLWF